MPTRTVKLSTNGRNQAVRIPRDLELPGDTAIICKEGERLILEPAPLQPLLSLLKTLKPIANAFPEGDDPPPRPVTL